MLFRSQTEANPGDSFMIPMYYTPDPRTPIRSLVAEIEFVSNNLTFQKAKAGQSVEDAAGTVESTVTEGRPDDKNITRSKARIAVSVPENAKKGLPEGLVAYLLFQVSTKAKPFSIKLNTTIVSARGVRDENVANIKVQSGMVILDFPDNSPQAACFFFSH